MLGVVPAAARLLDLLGLLQVRRYWSGAELARRLDVDARTVRRDVARLRSLGYPVQSTRGTAGGYRLDAGGEVPPLLLDDQEAIAIAVALRTAAAGTVAGLEETAVRALAKLERLLPTRLRRRVAAVSRATLTLASDPAGVDPGLLVTLAAAARDREGLALHYHTHSGESSRRHLEPHRLVHTGRRWYLLAYDRDRQDWRTLRVDRIQGTPMPDRRFAERPLPTQDIADYVSRSISQAPYAYQTRAIVQAPADQVRTRIPPTAAQITELDPNSCAVQTGSNTLEQLSVYLGLLGAPFTIDGPPELHAHLATLATRFAAAAATP